MPGAPKKDTDKSQCLFPTIFICINRSHEFHKTEGSKHLHLAVVLKVRCALSTSNHLSPQRNDRSHLVRVNSSHVKYFITKYCYVQAFSNLYFMSHINFQSVPAKLLRLPHVRLMSGEHHLARLSMRNFV